MTDEQVAALGPAFADYLRSFRPCFVTRNTFAHLGTYARGLLSDLPRKSVEPVALAAGCAVRTLQEFLTHHVWDHGRMRDELQRRVARDHLPAPGSRPAGGVGVVGWVDETGVAKKGDKTPGVQRQYCGASGKVDNCVVTVHLACQCGAFMALLDSDPFLPEHTWGADRGRCRAAHVPDDVGYRSKWRVALEQVDRARGNGVRFDWLTSRRVVRRQAGVPRGARRPRAAVRLRGAAGPAVLREPPEVPLAAAAVRGQAGRQRVPVRQAVAGHALEAGPAGPQDDGRPGVGGAGRAGPPRPRRAADRPHLLAGRRPQRRHRRGEVLRVQRAAADGTDDAVEGRVHAGGRRARVPPGEDGGGLRPLRGPQLPGADAAHGGVPASAAVRRRADGPAAGGKTRR